MAQYHTPDSKAHPKHLARSSSSPHTPEISLIIPTYNAQAYITRCLESCLQQSFENIELLVIDDCGSDDSIQIAKEYAKKDSRIRIIHNPQNLGTFHARKQGILHAKSAFCMFADPDDYLSPQACEIAYKAIKTHQSDMVHFGINYIPKDFKKIRPIVHKGRLEGESMRIFLSAKNNTQGLWDKIYRTEVLRQALEKLEFVKPPLCMLEDGLLVLVASLESTSYVGIKPRLYNYYANPNSITKSPTLANFRKKQAQFDKMLHITTHLLSLYPQHTKLLKTYQRKVSGAFLSESRHFGSLELYSSLQILSTHHLEKNLDIPAYLKAMILSLCYAFRWQNLVRIVLFVLSFGIYRL